MPETKRKRISHGERTRSEILDVAEGLATREGLEGLTISRLAEEVGMSKGGVFAHFGSKEALQLATIAAARERFSREITEPLVNRSAGLPQLFAAFDLYFDYVARRLAEGGCFFTASTLEMADRPGAVRDQIAEFLETRAALISMVLGEARRRGEISRATDIDQLAFELSSLAAGAMVELQMFKSEQTIERAREAVKSRVEGCATAKGKKLLVS